MHLMVDRAEQQIGSEQRALKRRSGPSTSASEAIFGRGPARQEEGRGDQPDAEHLVIKREPEIALPFGQERAAMRRRPRVEQDLEQDGEQQAGQREQQGARERVPAALLGLFL